MTTTTHSKDIATRQRFAFGENRSNFLHTLDEERIMEADRSLKQMLEIESLKNFLNTFKPNNVKLGSQFGVDDSDV